MLIGSNEGRIHSNMVYLLADVMESLMIDAMTFMKRNGETLKHESKRHYNNALWNLRKMKDSTTKGCCLEAQNDYGNDADHICELLKLIVDRSGRDDRVLADIFEYVKAKPSKLDMKNIDFNTMDSIEKEEFRKAQKQVHIACEVFGIDDFNKKFSKDARYARMLVVKSLEEDGLQRKHIAEKLKLNIKTVNRLLRAYSDTFDNNERLKWAEKEFMKQFLKSDIYINKK